MFAETAALGQKTPSASQGSFIINEMTRSNSLSIDPATGGYIFNVRPGGVFEASAEWSVSNEITFTQGTISTPGEYTFCDRSLGPLVFKLTPGKSYVMYIKYIRGTIPANLENWAFTFSSGGKTVSMNLNNTLPVEVFVPVAGDLAFGGRFTPNEAADPSITFDKTNKYTVQILMVEVNNGSNQGIIIHKNDLADTVQVNSQTFTEDQKTQARTNIGALSSTDLNVWLQRTTNEEDLNTLANVENGKAYISRYATSTANTPEANTQGNVISFRNSEGELTQIAMEVQSGKVYYRASATSADFGTWKEIDMTVGKGSDYIAFSNGLKIQWGEANVPSEITAGTVITPTIRLPIAMATTSYKVLGSCSRSDINIGYGDRNADSFVLGLRNLGTSAVTTSSTYTWVVIGY